MATRRLAAVPAAVSEPAAGGDPIEALAARVRMRTEVPPLRAQRLDRRVKTGPTAFDKYMTDSWKTGKFASLETTLDKVGDLRLRLARSMRYLRKVHAAELEKLLGQPPYTFTVTLVVTDRKGNKLAEGGIRGTLKDPRLDQYYDKAGPEAPVVLWFQMHLPRDLGRRRTPEAGSQRKEDLRMWLTATLWRDGLKRCTGGDSGFGPGSPSVRSGGQQVPLRDVTCRIRSVMRKN